MSPKTPLIRVIDDDLDLLNSVEFLLKCEGYEVAAYTDAQEFLRADSPSRPGCLVLDEQMPIMTGQELQSELNARKSVLPIIFLTAHGDIDMAVQTMIRGAVDFQQKPIKPEKCLISVARAGQIDLDRRGGASDLKDEIIMYEKLTEREEQICRLVADGLINKEIGERLGISKRTVDHVRASAVNKLQGKSAAQLAAFFRRIDSVKSDN